MAYARFITAIVVQVINALLCTSEAAEIDPPHGEHEPLDVIDLIPLDDPPTFNDISPWSPEFIDFVDQCLIKDPAKRPTAGELLQVCSLKFKFFF